MTAPDTDTLAGLREELRLIGCHQNGEARCTCAIGADAVDAIDALRAQAAKDKARIERLEAALRPFAEAWGVALQQAGDHPDSLRTLGPLGALAAHQVSGVHFQRARAALEDGE